MAGGRCVRRAVAGQSFCTNHYMQGINRIASQPSSRAVHPFANRLQDHASPSKIPSPKHQSTEHRRTPSSSRPTPNPIPRGRQPLRRSGAAPCNSSVRREEYELDYRYEKEEKEDKVEASDGDLARSPANTNNRGIGSRSSPPLCCSVAKTGRQCLNMTHAANGLCWKHQPNESSTSPQDPTPTPHAARRDPRSPLRGVRFRASPFPDPARLAAPVEQHHPYSSPPMAGQSGSAHPAAAIAARVAGAPYHGYYDENGVEEYHVENGTGEHVGVLRAFRSETLLRELLRRSVGRGLGHE